MPELWGWLSETGEKTAKCKHCCAEFFQAFVQKVYGVSYEKVSKQQLADLTCLHFYDENGCSVVEYAREDGKIQRVELEDSLSINMGDDVTVVLDSEPDTEIW